MPPPFQEAMKDLKAGPRPLSIQEYKQENENGIPPVKVANTTTRKKGQAVKEN